MMLSIIIIIIISISLLISNIIITLCHPKGQEHVEAPPPGTEQGRHIMV